MGKTKRTLSSGQPGGALSRSQSGPMDDFITGPRGLQDDTASSVPASPGSSIAGSSRGTVDPAALSQISMDIAAISSSMLTRRDKSEMVAELRAVIREEIAAVRADLTALEHRVDALDADRIQNAHRQQAVDLATTRQGNLLLDLRRAGGITFG
ncbi:Hypothetical predicted protein, partial [Pelobates cultripes]